MQRGPETLFGFEAARVQELFCYLLLYRDRPHSRESLVAQLWGDKSSSQSKSYFRKTLWQLQAALNRQLGLAEKPLLVAEPGWVQLDSAPCLWLDVALLEEAFHLVHGVPGRLLDAGQIETLQYVAGLYHGDLLEGWYQDWCLFERERLRHAYLSILDKLMDYCESVCRYEHAVVYGEQVLRHDGARERTHRQLMRLYYLAGDRTAALRQYEHCCTALRDELGVGPARSTQTLYEHIRTGSLPARTVPQPSQDAEHDKGARSLELSTDLQRLRASLRDLREQVKHTLRAIDRAEREQ